jgi:hypothetical protein
MAAMALASLPVIAGGKFKIPTWQAKWNGVEHFLVQRDRHATDCGQQMVWKLEIDAHSVLGERPVADTGSSS